MRERWNLVIGIVKFHNREYGYGFIKVDGHPDHYFKSMDCPEINKGDIVEFNSKKTNKGLQALTMKKLNLTKPLSKPKMIIINNERIPIKTIRSYELDSGVISYISKTVKENKNGFIRGALALASIATLKMNLIPLNSNEVERGSYQFKYLNIHFKNGTSMKLYSDEKVDFHINTHIKQGYEPDETFSKVERMIFCDTNIDKLIQTLDRVFNAI